MHRIELNDRVYIYIEDPKYSIYERERWNGKTGVVTRLSAKTAFIKLDGCMTQVVFLYEHLFKLCGRIRYNN
jgi:hypothetical protein